MDGSRPAPSTPPCSPGRTVPSEATEVRLAAPRAGEVELRIEATEQAVDDLAAGRALRTLLVT
jgi:hypothetical protein